MKRLNWWTIVVNGPKGTKIQRASALDFDMAMRLVADWSSFGARSFLATSSSHPA